jgi:Domain of unknown function (DUF397)
VSTWRKSSFSSENGTCVEVALTRPAVGIRDSKNVESGHLTVNPTAWAALVNAVKGR